VNEPQPVERAGRVREWPFATVLLVLAIGLVVTSRGYFRVGCVVAGASVLLAAVLRAFLPERRAGLLVVRNRALDVVFMVVIGVAVIVLAIIVPPGHS
jgi:amino acid permease